MANHLQLDAIFFLDKFGLRLFRQDIFLRIKGIFSTRPALSINPYTNLMQLENFTPQMFLYSDSDKLIPAKVRSKLNNYLFTSARRIIDLCIFRRLQDIERFASFRQHIGVPVETVCFHDAEHVKLYIRHPRKYIHCVCTFISDCLASIPIVSSE